MAPRAPSEDDSVRLSPGVLLAALGDLVVAYDVITETTHLLEGSAAWLLNAADARSTTALAEEVAAAAGVEVGDALARIAEAAHVLSERALVNRDDPAPPIEPWLGSHAPIGNRAVGLVHRVVDQRLAFRSADPGLLADLDALFAGGEDRADPTIVIDADPTPDGGVAVGAASEWRFPTLRECRGQMVDVVNEYAARSLDVAVLHAAGVHTPDGQVWVLPGAVDAGKSTLVAALVQAGCDYLGDEAIGIRPGSLCAIGYPKPLTLDAASRAALDLPANDFPQTHPTELRPDVTVLHGDHGPIDRILLPHFAPDLPASHQRLTHVDALKALLHTTLNLGRVDDEGLQSICDLVMRTPTIAVTHHDATALAEVLLGSTAAGLPDDLDRKLQEVRLRHDDGRVLPPTLDDLASAVPRRSPGAISRDDQVDGRPMTVVSGEGVHRLMSGPAADLWHRIDGTRSITNLILEGAESHGGSLRRAARDSLWLLDWMRRQGLIIDQGLELLPSSVEMLAACGVDPTVLDSVAVHLGTPSS